MLGVGRANNALRNLDVRFYQFPPKREVHEDVGRRRVECCVRSCSARAYDKLPQRFCNVHFAPPRLWLFSEDKGVLVLNLRGKHRAQLWRPVNATYLSRRTRFSVGSAYLYLLQMSDTVRKTVKQPKQLT